MTSEDFFNYEDYVNEPNNHNRIKGGKSGMVSDTGNPESVIPPTAMKESGLSGEEDFEPSSSDNCVTKLE